MDLRTDLGRLAATAVLASTLAAGGLAAGPGVRKEDLRVGWLQVVGQDANGVRTLKLKNQGRMPLHYSANAIGPAYVYFRMIDGNWRDVGPGWCGNGLESAILGPGDSLQFRIGRELNQHDRVRIGIPLYRLDSRDEFYATTLDSLDFGTKPR